LTILQLLQTRKKITTKKTKKTQQLRIIERLNYI